MKQASVTCQLGNIEFGATVVMHDNKEIRQFARSTFTFDDATRRLMNRAARATDNVIGVRPSTEDGSTFEILVSTHDETGRKVSLADALTQWSMHFQQEAGLIRYDAVKHCNVVNYAEPAMAESAEVDMFHNHSS